MSGAKEGVVNIRDLEPRWDQLRLLIGEFNQDLPDHPVHMRIDDGPDGKTLWVSFGESAVGVSLDGSQYSYRPPVRRSMEEVLDFLRECYWETTGNSSWPPCSNEGHVHPMDLGWAFPEGAHWVCPRSGERVRALSGTSS